MTINVELDMTGGNTAQCHFTVKHAINENITDMHYFCVSVIKDLISQQHQIKAYDTKQTITYPFELFGDDMVDSFIDVLNYMQEVIIQKKLENDIIREKFSDN